MAVQTDKRADLAGPGIGSYDELERILPDDYVPALSPRRTMEALYAAKRVIEDRLCETLGLTMVQVPLIVEAASGVNDYLDRDGSRSPIGFHISNDGGRHPLDAEVVQAATKWKRLALRQFDMAPGEGLLTDMRAVRKDYVLDHDHSVYVDQWDWEKAILPEQRTLDYLTETVRAIWGVLKETETMLRARWPELADPRYPELPAELTFLHAEDVLAEYPDLPRKQRETMILQEHPAVFIYGIGWPLADGLPHELRAADYDDWSTETVSADGRPMHGLNGDILVWNPVTRRRHELMSGGIRVTKESLVRQLELSGQLDFLEQPYHRAIVNDEVPLSIGGGIGQSRTMRQRLAARAEGDVRAPEHPRARVGEPDVLRVRDRVVAASVISTSRVRETSRTRRRKGEHMRRLLVILGAVAALALPAAANAGTTVETITFDSTFPLCNGDLIQVSGPLLAVISDTSTPSGGEVVAFHFQPQGVTGVDLVTGTVFHATGLTRDIVVNSPPGGTTETFVNQFHIQATGGAQSFLVTELFHVTVTPDGTVTAFFDNFSSTC
jgi:aspartate--ammonia ligase